MVVAWPSDKTGKRVDSVSLRIELHYVARSLRRQSTNSIIRCHMHSLHADRSALSRIRYHYYYCCYYKHTNNAQMNQNC